MNRARIPLVALLLSLFCFTTAFAADQDYSAIFEAGVKAYQEGDYDTAYLHFTTVLQKYPRDAKVRNYWYKTKSALKSGASKSNIEGQLSQLVIKDFEVDGADLDSVFDYLRQKATELSGGKFTPNFIYRGTPEDKAEARVTLKLSSIPMDQLIRYIGEQTATDFRYEQHAVVATPKRMTREAEVPATEFGAAKKSPF